MMYKPNPIDTDNISLPEDLLDLTEKIAENVHDNWAIGRINAGWVFAEQRDDVKKNDSVPRALLRSERRRERL